MTKLDSQLSWALGPAFVFMLFSLFSDPAWAEPSSPESVSVLQLGYPIRPWTTQNASIDLREDLPFASAFLKQLRRQAVLLAAREELGALTRDAFLDENAPAGAPEIKDVDRFLVDNLGFVEGLFAQDVDYPAFLARLEKLSRNELVEALLPLGFSRIQAVEQSEIPSREKKEIEKRLLEYDVTTQLDALRRLHAAIRKHGETPELLRMLVRGYTQLQILTNASFRDSHRVFQARALLYAQRLVAKYGESPETVSMRAVAWSLNNFHRLARNDFKTLPEDHKPDDWTRLARLYAEYDLPGIAALIESEKDNPERKWAVLLKFVLLTYTNNGTKTAAPYAKSVLKNFSDCPRFYLNLFAFENFFSPTLPDGTRLQEQWASQIPRSLRKMDVRPAEISKAGLELQKSFGEKSSGGLAGLLFGGARRPEENNPGGFPGDPIPPETFYAELSVLFQAMNSAPPASGDEPSFRMLATLLQDEIFFAVTLCASRQDEPDSVIGPARSAIESHPLMNHLGLGHRDAKLKAEFVERFKKVKIPYELLAATRLGFDFPEEKIWKGGHNITPYVFAMRFGDRENVRDLFAYHQELRRKIDRTAPAFTLDRLEKLCPENPFVAAERIARTQSVEPVEADALLEKFASYPNFRDAISAYYLQKGERRKAIPVLSEMQKAEPGVGFANRVVQLYLEEGDIPGAVEYLRGLLDDTDDPAVPPQPGAPVILVRSWWRGDAAAILGRILCYEKNDEEAEACFDRYVQESPHQGRSLKARFLETSGRFDEALRLWENDPNQYFIFRDLCRKWSAFYRMDSDRVFDFTDVLFKEYEEQRKQNRLDPSMKAHLFFVSYCLELPMQDLFGADPAVRVFFEHQDAIAGFIAYFEALEAGDAGKADALLRLLQDRGSLLGRGELARVVGRAKLPSGTGNPSIKKPVYRILASLFALDRQREKPGSLDPADVETLLQIGTADMLRNEDALFVLYLIGRYYTACGQREKGLECYRRVCASRNLDALWSENLAAKELRDAGEKYSDALRVDAKLSRVTADSVKAEEWSRQLSNQLRVAESAHLTTVSESDTIFEVRRSELLVTDIFPGGWTTWNAPQARLIRKRPGRSYDSAWSRDGKYVALASDQHLALLWDPKTGDDFGGIRRTKEARGSAIAFTPDDASVLFGASDGSFGVWTPKQPGDAEPDWQKIEHTKMSSVSVSQDGKRFCSTSDSDQNLGVFLWDAQTGDLLHTMKDHSMGIYDAVFFDGGRRLITGARDRTAFIYNVATGRPYRSLQGHQKSIRVVAVSPDDRIIATGSNDNTLMIWDARSGEPIRTLGMFDGDVVSLAFSPDGTRLAVCRSYQGETACILDTKTWKPTMFLPGQGFAYYQPAWSPDGRYLVTSGRETRLWDVSPDDPDVESGAETSASLPDEMPLRAIKPHYFLIGSEPEWQVATFRSARKEFRDSIWAHASSRITYRLDGAWKTFRTSYGIREGAVLSQASCIFIVLGDGKLLFRSELIADTLDRPLELDIRNVRTLELIVDQNRNNFNDHGVWFSPKLLR